MSQTAESKNPTFAQIQMEISAMLDIPDNELDESQQAAMSAYLDELGRQEAAKVDGFAQFIKLEEARAASIKEESRRLTDKAKAIENRLKSLKGHYVQIMLTNGLKKIQGDKYTLALGKSESTEAPEDEAELLKLADFNPVFVKEKITYSPDKSVIKEALKSGMEIPGCRLVENIGLRIR